MIDVIKSMIFDFNSRTKRKLVKRDLEVPVNSGKVITIIGPRRSGKSCYLLYLISELQKKISKSRIIYLNFEDDRIDKENFNFQNILDAYCQLHPKNNLKDVYFFFDEIQVLDNWEVFVRRLTETVTSNIFITGSSSKMLSSEIASSLRGRSISYSLLPLSFIEYCRFKKIDTKDIYSTKNKSVIYVAYQKFLYNGGFPETVFFDDELRIKTLQTYSDIMLYRDLIERHNIGNIYVLKDMMRRLFANSARSFSVNKYFNDLKSRGYKVSKNSLYDFLEYFFDAFIFSQLTRFSESSIKSNQTVKKIYSIDTGLASACNYSISKNYGLLLENLVFNELFKQNSEIYFLKNCTECDFVTIKNNSPKNIIQVCYNLNKNNQDREITGAVAALKYFNKENAVILTDNIEKTIEIDEFKLMVIPTWKWLCEK